MILALLASAFLAVVSLVVMAVCAVKALPRLRRIADNSARIATATDKIHLQLGNLIGIMPKDWDLTELWRRGGR